MEINTLLYIHRISSRETPSENSENNQSKYDEESSESHDFEKYSSKHKSDHIRSILEYFHWSCRSIRIDFLEVHGFRIYFIILIEKSILPKRHSTGISETINHSTSQDDPSTTLDKYPHRNE